MDRIIIICCLSSGLTLGCLNIGNQVHKPEEFSTKPIKNDFSEVDAELERKVRNLAEAIYFPRELKDLDLETATVEEIYLAQRFPMLRDSMTNTMIESFRTDKFVTGRVSKADLNHVIQRLKDAEKAAFAKWGK
ncbi:MAG: hypothetical protein H8E27_06220 [Verrucomicrobia subdivision 3 bacterium]|nr:hypothetical protein [Limisphaerales bacterium]